jgi:RimJ/RimL family protein N-acetyltransferase
VNGPCRFETSRLAIDDWHRLPSSGNDGDLLPEFVCALLSPAVTGSLPAAWQGDYSLERARNWIEDRDKESVVSLVAYRESGLPAGLLILADSDWPDVHIGFLLLQSEWGKGLASELVEGLVTWCRVSGVRSVRGGVAENNIASQRVLEKLGFTQIQSAMSSSERFYELLLQR